jgi:exopolyphosphatase/pppGpp-phosphohydrolase
MKQFPDVLAAVDLGSNSFHMVVARYTHGQLVSRSSRGIDSSSASVSTR